MLFRNIGTLYPTTQLNIPEDSHIEGKGSVLINTTPEIPYVEMEVQLHFLRSGTSEVNPWLHTSTAFCRTESLRF